MPVEALPKVTIVWPTEVDWQDKPIKVIYLAGPFRADTQWKIIQNVRRAEEASLKLWKIGYIVICPHTMTQNFQGECPDYVWLDGCIELLKRCDAIFLMRNYKQSIGSLEELKVAQELGLAIIYEEPPNLPPHPKDS